MSDEMANEGSPARSVHDEVLRRETSSPGPQPAPALIRRSRISLACRNCRSRKTKCDGVQPTCSTCRHIGVDCVYARASQQPNVRRSTNRAQLIQKINELEQQLRITAEPSTPNGLRIIGSPATQHSNGTYILDRDQERDDIVSNVPDAAFEIPDHESTEDTQAAKVFQDQHASEFGYFGPSSHHAFFRSMSRSFIQVLRGATLQHDQSQPLTTTILTDNGRVSHEYQKSDARLGVSATLPTMSESLLMIDRFFATSAPVFLFVSKAVLIEALQDLASGLSKPGLGTKKALVYIVFAHSCLAVGDPSDNLYYQRSLQDLIPETLRGANQRLIQALLLLTSYQQQQQMSVSSWTYHALAVKAAFQLGLHCPSSYKELSPADAGLSTRLWYSLINQDRLLCMCLGRPCLIPEVYVCTPKLADPRLAHRLSSIIQDHQLESLLHHKSLTDLYSIVASLLSELYQHNIEREEQPNIWELLASRLKLCRQFEGWRHNLDHRLKLVTPQEASTIFTVQSSDARFRLSLTMHYYRVLVMLNGPILSQLLDLAVNHATTDDDLQSLFEQCVPVLTNNFGVLKSLHQILCVTARAENFLNQNNAWWLSNHAGSILAMHLFSFALLSQVYPALATMTGIPAPEIRNLLGECLENMKVLKRTSVLFRRAREALERFSRELDSICQGDLPTPNTFDSGLTSGFNMCLSGYGARISSDLLGNPDFDFLLGDGLYC